jgi:hypothetical protein
LRILNLFYGFASGNLSGQGFLSTIQKIVHIFSCFIKTWWISSKKTSQAAYYAPGPPIPRSQRVHVDGKGRYYKFLKSPSFLKPPVRIVGFADQKYNLCHVSGSDT